MHQGNNTVTNYVTGVVSTVWKIRTSIQKLLRFIAKYSVSQISISRLQSEKSFQLFHFGWWCSYFQKMVKSCLNTINCGPTYWCSAGFVAQYKNLYHSAPVVYEFDGSGSFSRWKRLIRDVVMEHWKPVKELSNKLKSFFQIDSTLRTHAASSTI